MTNLMKAPLLEVIFEIRWNSSSSDEMTKFPFLLGVFRECVKGDFPELEMLMPNPTIPFEAFINNPTHRFWSKNKSYPLLQIGPGVITVNTIHDAYKWDSYSKLIQEIGEILVSRCEFSTSEIVFALKYLDFYPVDPLQVNLYQYLSDNLHLNIVSNLLEGQQPLTLNFGTAFKSPDGIFNLIVHTAKVGVLQQDGIIVESNINHSLEGNSFHVLPNWLVKAHDFLSQFFKDMTNGRMYESFK